MTRTQFPFDKSVCDCVVDGFPECQEKKSGRTRNVCHHGDFNIRGVGRVVSELIKEYFDSDDRKIPRDYRRHVLAGRNNY